MTKKELIESEWWQNLPDDVTVELTISFSCVNVSGVKLTVKKENYGDNKDEGWCAVCE